jgi:hypothetical protein
LTPAAGCIPGRAQLAHTNTVIPAESSMIST